MTGEKRRSRGNVVEIEAPPHSIEAEQAVLGALLLDNTLWDEIRSEISAEDFYRHDHQLIFRAIETIRTRPTANNVDVVTLSEWMGRMGQLEEAGGIAYIGTLAKDTPTTAHALSYARLVRDYAVRRRLLAFGQRVRNHVLSEKDAPIEELMEQVSRDLNEVDEHIYSGDVLESAQLKNGVKRVIEEMEVIAENGGPLGEHTGYADLDRMIPALAPGNLIVLAARPSMGKTTLAMNIVSHIAREAAREAEDALSAGEEDDRAGVVLVFSAEMSTEELSRRFLSSESGLDMDRIIRAELKDDGGPMLAAGIKRMAPWYSRVLVFDTRSCDMSLQSIMGLARKARRKHGRLRAIVVDYLQLLAPPNEAASRVEQVSEISRRLKRMAGELDCPLIALSQLNRNLETRPNKRPVMADLRESGGIEQDADVILFIYRDEVYVEDSPDRGKAEIIIGKQRNGAIGTIRLRFNGSRARFENLDEAHEDYLPTPL